MNGLKKLELHQLILPINLFFQLYQIKVQYDMDYNIIMPLILIFSQRILRIVDFIIRQQQAVNLNNNGNSIDISKTFITILKILLYFDKIYYDYLYDNGTPNAYFLGMVYYQTFYNLLFSIKMIQGSLPQEIDLKEAPSCYNIWVFHESYLNVQGQSCYLSSQTIETRSYQFIFFALINGLLIFTGLHIATKIGCDMKSEIMYILKVRILESVKYFTISFFKVFLISNYPVQYIITQVIKIISIKNLPLNYVPIQKNDFIMSSLFQVNLYPATLCYTVQGIRIIQEQNMRDTWLFLIIEQVDNVCSISFYLLIVLQFRNHSLLYPEFFFILISILAQVVNLLTMIHTWYLLKRFGPILTLNINKTNPSCQEVKKMVNGSLKIITQQIKIVIIEQENDKSDSVLSNLDMIRMMFQFSKTYDIYLSYKLSNNTTIIFQLFFKVKKFHISMSNYQLIEDNYKIFQQICQLSNDQEHSIEFNRYNSQRFKLQDEFKVYKFKLLFIKIAFPKQDISFSIKKIFNKYEFDSNTILKKYVATCHQVVAYLKIVESEMLFHPKQILYDLYDSQQ
ncbi:transmembrane protein, putative (macronuclear) [Tetrahymena thermophila SB210]|uniref:Transmembrane protein, putative n=1 Tax=Tetrahymena thermophila (strain SB210) TaxID=312017 RepID=W7XIT2_TETTS|nr:transmembrane protein, putative [Tetrahymena thermophila SB210]EWS74891.1 transmembrane protein, putative [Tetrahymena thermophila SB210]|eukprot:XP_012652604.1 transmembrane protein, putative [Tetrahymena thermophila SB210]